MGTDMNGCQNGILNGFQSENEKSKRKETEEERRIRKERERKEKEERYRREGKRPETEEERRIRKEKEREERHKRKDKETEEERKIRKEKEREKRNSEGKRKETEEERRIRKEKEHRRRTEREAQNGNESKILEEINLKEDIKPFEISNQEIKQEHREVVKIESNDDDEETPLGRSKSKKRKSSFIMDDVSDSVSPSPAMKKPKIKIEKPEEDEDFKSPSIKKPNQKRKSTATPKSVKKESETTPKNGTGKKAKKEEEEKNVWKWWEEEKADDGTKWKFLQHKGPLFAPPYEPLPDSVNFYYNGKRVKLSEEAEEVASFYGRMLDHDYTTKEVFNKNFFKDWRKIMTEKEKELIRDLSKCDFTEIDAYFKKLSEERKNRTKEEKKAEKERNEAIQKEYGVAIIDGHEEKIGNFRVEPPGLFRGRGEHPKQGMVKRRVLPEDVIINCSQDSKWPEPPAGHKWKEVRHDNTVTWLASWTENIQNQIKYVMLNPSSRLKGEKDMEKYEKARKLKDKIVKIREDYTADFKSKEMRVRQRAVALYFIDKLALRAGNEKDEDQADTVGCCSLRVEHITLHENHNGKEHVVEFDFLGKDSIRYHNFVQVDKRVFKNLLLFMENKKGEDDLFDRLNTSILNDYLSSLMPGLTAKVFRTYNASITLQDQLKKLTDSDDNIPAKMLSYNRANRAVAILCNHQRAIPKTHDKSMANLEAKIEKKQEDVDKAEKEYKSAKKSKSADAEKKKNTLKRLLEQLNKLETQRTDKEENKQIALGTSKLNYLDPRISVAWCKKFGVPIEKVYNKTQREKFRWAIDMTDEDYEF